MFAVFCVCMVLIAFAVSFIFGLAGYDYSSYVLSNILQYFTNCFLTTSVASVIATGFIAKRAVIKIENINKTSAWIALGVIILPVAFGDKAGYGFSLMAWILSYVFAYFIIRRRLKVSKTSSDILRQAELILRK